MLDSRFSHYLTFKILPFDIGEVREFCTWESINMLVRLRSLCNDSDVVLQSRQVSTQPEKLHKFFAELARDRIVVSEAFIVVVEENGHKVTRHKSHTPCLHLARRGVPVSSA